MGGTRNMCTEIREETLRTRVSNVTKKCPFKKLTFICRNKTALQT